MCSFCFLDRATIFIYLCRRLSFLLFAHVAVVVVVVIAAAKTTARGARAAGSTTATKNKSGCVVAFHPSSICQFHLASASASTLVELICRFVFSFLASSALHWLLYFVDPFPCSGFRFSVSGVAVFTGNVVRYQQHCEGKSRA